MKHAFLYFHGGPGLNAHAENEILTPAFEARGSSIGFWQEPDVASAVNAFSLACDSILRVLRETAAYHRVIHVIGHSFAAQALIRVATLEPGLFGSLTLVAPMLSRGNLKRLALLAQEDFSRMGDESSAAAIEVLLSESREHFDGAMRSAIQIAATDTNLFSHYWHNREAMDRYYSAWTKEGVSLNTGNFFAIWDELGRIRGIEESAAHTLEVPTRIIWGEHDPVSAADSDMTVARAIFPQLEVLHFDRSSHYPHLEETDRFLNALGL